MAAPRATQWIALRNLARNGGSHHQVRSLHMTGPATYASPVLTKERPILNLPRDIAGLRAECKRRKIETTGSQQDLVARLNANEIAHSRAFSTINSKRPTSSESATSSNAPVRRHFNTSRALKAVNDSSTIDFTYFPEFESTTNTDLYSQVRVPILPTNTTPTESLLAPEVIEPIVMKPQINTMSADAVFLPMSELSDGHAMNIDFHAMADRVAANIRSMKVPVEEQASLMKQIFGDMVDDVIRTLATKPKLAI